ncbi:MAG: hypothetical protein WB992_09480, partial [Bryobacteraceae bacterium]
VQPFKHLATTWRFLINPSHSNAVMAIFSFLLLVATICYTVFAALQWRTMGDTLNEMKRSGNVTTDQVWHAIDNMNWMAQSMDGSLKKLSKQAEDTHQLAASAGEEANASKTIAGNGSAQAAATNTLARAAKDSSITAKQQLEAASRPWIVAGVSIWGPVTFDDFGPRVRFDVTTSNVGHSPAIDIKIEPELISSVHGEVDIMGDERKLCGFFERVSRDTGWGDTLFPGDQPTLQRFALPVSHTSLPTTISRDAAGRSVHSGPDEVINIIGCVCYRMDVSQVDRPHHTCFGYELFAVSDSGTPIAFTKDSGEIPLNRLKLFKQSQIGLPPD